jgi:hypothetical protein
MGLNIEGLRNSLLRDLFVAFLSTFQNDFYQWGWNDRLSECDDVYALSIVLFDFGQDDSNQIKSNQINRSEHTRERDEKQRVSYERERPYPAKLVHWLFHR